MSTTVRLPLARRLRFGLLVLTSQILLLALAIAWLFHMVLIAANGSVYFMEDNPFVLWGELAAIIMISIFATYVLVIQIQRLGERRTGERINRN